MPGLVDQARETMGAIADAFALDQQFTNGKAQRELGWSPGFDDPLGQISRPAIKAGKQQPARDASSPPVR